MPNAAAPAGARAKTLRERLDAMSPHRRYHTLNTLVRAIADADQRDRLESLLDDDVWMQARLEAEEFDYGGFRQDLEVAEAAFRRPVDTDPLSAHAVDSLALLVRTALLRAITNSLAMNVHAAVGRQALERGVWSPRRAAAVVGRVPDPQPKLELCLALLASGRLGAIQSGIVQEHAVAAAWAQEYEHQQVQASRSRAPRHGSGAGAGRRRGAPPRAAS